MKINYQLILSAMLLLLATVAHTQTITVTEKLSKDGVYFRESYLKNDYYFTLGKISKKKMMRMISVQDKALNKWSFVNHDTIQINIIDSSFDGCLAIWDFRLKEVKTDCKTGKLDSNYSRLVQTVFISSVNNSMKVLATVDSLSIGDAQQLKELFENMGTVNINGSQISYTVGKTYKFPVKFDSKDNNGMSMSLDEMTSKKLVKSDGENLVFKVALKSKNTGQVGETKCKSVQDGEGAGIEMIEISTGIKASEIFRTEFSVLSCPDITGSHIFLKDEIIKEGFRSFAKK